MRPLARVAVSLALLIGAALLPQFRASVEGVPIARPLSSLPTAIGGWEARSGSVLDPEILDMLKPKDYVMRRYQDPEGRSLWLFIGYWDSQRKGAQPHSPKNCLPGSGWEPLEATRTTIPLPAPLPPITVNRYLVQKDRDQQVVFYWYQHHGGAVAGDLEARLNMARNAILGYRTDGALVRVSAPVQGSIEQTSDRLVKYIQAMYPTLHDYLPD